MNPLTHNLAGSKQSASQPARQSRQRTRRTYLKPLHKETCATGSNGRIQTTHTKKQKTKKKRAEEADDGENNK